MFDSLDEQMRKDDRRMSSTKERLMRWAIMAAAAIIVCGSVILGVRFMS